MIDVSTRGPHWDIMAPRWTRSSALLGGTEAMRNADRSFLPPFPAESEVNYARRRDMATLTNFYRKAAHSMVGNIFREDMVVDTGLPEAITADIDRRGTNIQKFAQDIAFSLITAGVQAVIVDHPRVENPLTFRDEIDQRIRPYAFLADHSSIIAIHEQWVNGESVPVYVARYEKKLLLTDNGYEQRSDIVVIRRNMETGATTFERYEDDKGGYSSTPSEVGPVTFPRVPLIIGYANSVEKEACYCARPLLDDIAFKNIQHWQFASSQDNILELAAFPEKVLKTANPEEFKELNTLRDPSSQDPSSFRFEHGASGKLPIGPHLMRIIGVDDDYSYVTAPMDGVEARAARLKELVADAQLMALDLVVTSAPQTATARILDRLEALSPLQRIAAETERVVNETLKVIAEWRGRGEEPGAVTINKDFGVTAEDSLQISALRDAFAAGAITQKTYLNGLKRLASVLSDMDVDREIADTETGDNGPTLGGDDDGISGDSRAVSIARRGNQERQGAARAR